MLFNFYVKISKLQDSILINKGDDTLHKATTTYLHVQCKAKKTQKGYFLASEVNVFVDFDYVSCT